MFERSAEEMLPTPTKAHYTFNLRDGSKVVQGVLMISRQKCQTAEMMARLWCHEAMRVFHDRLTDNADKQWFTKLVIELLTRSLGFAVTHEEFFEGDPNLFGVFLKPGADADDRLYELCDNPKKTAKWLTDYLDDYNAEASTRMNLIFFQDAPEHVTRVSRILRQPRGNAVLVRVGGSGKQSSTQVGGFDGRDAPLPDRTGARVWHRRVSGRHQVAHAVGGQRGGR